MIRLLIIFLFLSFWSTGQMDIYPYAPNLKADNLKGPVHLVEQTRIDVVEQNGEFIVAPYWNDDWKHFIFWEYDAHGNLLNAHSEGPGEIQMFGRFDYKNGKLTESIMQHEHRAFDYDSLDRITSEYYSTTQTRSLTSDNETPFDKSTPLKVDYYYDNTGNLILKKGFLSHDYPDGVDSIFYDEQKRPIKILTYNEDYIEFRVMSYDSLGNLVMLSVTTNEDGLLAKAQYTYQNDQLIEEEWTFFEDNVSVERNVSTYENGNVMVIVEEFIDDETITTEYIYDFDSMGNWIKKIEKRSDHPIIYLHTRKIEYYQ